MMKSKELKSYNLPENRAYNDSLEAKPIVFLFFLMSVGLISIVLKFYVFGGALFFLSCVCLLFLPNRIIIEFYDKYMIMYNKARKDECNIIYYDDVKSWEYKTSVKDDELIITLKDDSIQKCGAYSKSDFEAQLKKYLSNKQIKTDSKKKKSKKETA